MKLLKKERILKLSHVTFWFLVGAVLAAFLISSFAVIIFEAHYKDHVYPGVKIDGTDLSRKTQSQVKDYFKNRNKEISGTVFVFTHSTSSSSISAEKIDYGYDENLLATQAISVGRSSDPVSNISLILQAYLNGIDLAPSYHLSEDKLKNQLSETEKKVNVMPVDAQFKFENGRVTTFKPSQNGVSIDTDTINKKLIEKADSILESKKTQVVILALPTKIIKPKISTETVNNLGIKELIGYGTSLFQHSIPERVFNVTLAAQKINGILIAPDEIFSFDKALGDVSAFTGYKQAYVIQNGRTVLGDGGGVCQVSTTFFRAILNSGLPITERTAHAYRVQYYEQDSPPGIDATIFVPSVDLKFKNETGKHILIQTIVDPAELRLTVYLYGTKDGRQVTISQPVIVSQRPPPPPSYQDDPNLPAGSVKQVDFEAWGANVYFTREVKKDDEVIISEKFTSNYRPWQAVFLKGTKP